MLSFFMTSLTDTLFRRGSTDRFADFASKVVKDDAIILIPLNLFKLPKVLWFALSSEYYLNCFIEIVF